jgi:hypothetical protein
MLRLPRARPLPRQAKVPLPSFTGAVQPPGVRSPDKGAAGLRQRRNAVTDKESLSEKWKQSVPGGCGPVFFVIVIIMLAIDLFRRRRQQATPCITQGSGHLVWCLGRRLARYLPGRCGGTSTARPGGNWPTRKHWNTSPATSSKNRWPSTTSSSGSCYSASSPFHLNCKNAYCPGRARRHRYAHDHDLRRRLADYAIPLAALRFRRLPAGHWHQDVVVRRRISGPRQQSGYQMDTPAHEDQR